MASSAAKKIIPFLDRVLVRKMKPAQQTASGLYIPEQAQSTLNRGIVLAVGPGALNKDGQRIPINVTVGDQVILPSFSGTMVKENEKEDDLYIFRDSELLAKVEEGK